MKIDKKFAFIVLILFFIFLFFLIKNVNSPVINDIRYIKIANQLIKVDLAITQGEQKKGLSIKKIIGENEGMLFVFPKLSINNFWMKDMVFPIDIIWINEDMKIIYIEKNVKIDTYPQIFGPKIYSKYVLEVNSGFSEKNNLKENDFVYFVF